MISGSSDVSLSPNTIYVYLWRDKNPPKQIILGNAMFINLKMLDFEYFENVGKDGRWQNHEEARYFNWPCAGSFDFSPLQSDKFSPKRCDSYRMTLRKRNRMFSPSGNENSRPAKRFESTLRWCSLTNFLNWRFADVPQGVGWCRGWSRNVVGWWGFL